MITTSARAHVGLSTGARAMVPWLVGVVPFGLVIGVSAARADIPTSAGWLTGPLIYAGSAQAAVIDLLDAGAAPAVVIAAAIAVNSRLVLYSATMAPHWRGMSPWWQALAAYLLVEPSLAVGLDGYERADAEDTDDDRRRAHLHYLGGGALLWFAWLGAIAVGATVGARLPDGLHLELIVPLFLAGEVATRLTTPVARHAAGTAAGVAIVATGAPMHLGVLIAITAGVAAGLRFEARRT